MNEFKHTPAPWLIKEDKEEGDFHIISGCQNEWDIAKVWSSVGDYDKLNIQSTANAKLIAGAPNLILACEEVLKCLANAPERDYERNILLTAIEKATK